MSYSINFHTTPTPISFTATSTSFQDVLSQINDRADCTPQEIINLISKLLESKTDLNHEERSWLVFLQLKESCKIANEAFELEDNDLAEPFKKLANLLVQGHNALVDNSFDFLIRDYFLSALTPLIENPYPNDFIMAEVYALSAIGSSDNPMKAMNDHMLASEAYSKIGNYHEAYTHQIYFSFFAALQDPQSQLLTTLNGADFGAKESCFQEFMKKEFIGMIEVAKGKSQDAHTLYQLELETNSLALQGYPVEQFLKKLDAMLADLAS